MIWQGEWKGWCYSRRRCPQGCPSPWLWGQFGPTPLASLRHTESWPGSDFGFPASSPGSPGTCGWAREAFCPFSGQGTIWQLALLRTPALETERPAYHSQPVWGTYEYADRGWSWLAAPPHHVPAPPQLSCPEKPAQRGPSWNAISLPLPKDLHSLLKIWGLDYPSSPIALASSK